MSSYYKDKVAQLEQSRLDLIKSTMKLREENEKLKASLKRLRAKKRAELSQPTLKEASTNG